VAAPVVAFLLPIIRHYFYLVLFVSCLLFSYYVFMLFYLIYVLIQLFFITLRPFPRVSLCDWK